MSEFATQLLAIQQKIKNFTQAQPSDKGASDPSYKVYLAKCARLLDLDLQLNSIQNSPEDYSKAEMIEIIKDLDTQVSELIGNPSDDKNFVPEITASVAR